MKDLPLPEAPLRAMVNGSGTKAMWRTQRARFCQKNRETDCTVGMSRALSASKIARIRSATAC